MLVLIATAEIVRLGRRMGGLSTLEGLVRPPVLALAAFAAYPIWCFWLGQSLLSRYA